MVSLAAEVRSLGPRNPDRGREWFGIMKLNVELTSEFENTLVKEVPIGSRPVGFSAHPTTTLPVYTSRVRTTTRAFSGSRTRLVVRPSQPERHLRQ